MTSLVTGNIAAHFMFWDDYSIFLFALLAIAFLFV